MLKDRLVAVSILIVALSILTPRRTHAQSIVSSQPTGPRASPGDPPSLAPARWLSQLDPNLFNISPFIVDPATGQKEALPTDWYLGWLSFIGQPGSFTVTTTVAPGVGVVSATRSSLPGTVASSTVTVATTTISNDGNCWFLNGALQFCGFSALEWTAAFLMHCDSTLIGQWNLNATWTPTGGVAQSLPPVTFELLPPPRLLQVLATPSTIVTELPDERLLPINLPGGGILFPPPAGFPGFQDPGAPGGPATVTAQVTQLGCPCPVSGLPLDMKFVFSANTGGHSHLKSDIPATAPAMIPLPHV